MANSNGIITAPVRVREDVAAVLGLNSGDVGYLCKNSHGRINKWSLRKPIEHTKPSTLSEADFLSANFGYAIPSYQSYKSMTEKVNTGWTYNSPSTWGRVTDFNGYDHTATAPFALTLKVNSVTIGETISISTPTDISWLTNWGEWSAYQGTYMQYLNCGLYIPGVGYYPLTDTDQGLTIADIESGKLSFYADPALFVAGRTYNCYLILTTWDGMNGPNKWYIPSENEGGTWWVLATDTPLSFTMQKALNPFDYISVSGDGNADMQVVSGYYAWSNVVLNFNIAVRSGYTYSSGTMYIDVVFPLNYPGSGSSTASKTIATFNVPGIVADFSKSIQQTALDFNQLTSKEDTANATLSIRLVIGSTTYKSAGDIIITNNNA